MERRGQRLEDLEVAVGGHLVFRCCRNSSSPWARLQVLVSMSLREKVWNKVAHTWSGIVIGLRRVVLAVLLLWWGLLMLLLLARTHALAKDVKLKSRASQHVVPYLVTILRLLLLVAVAGLRRGLLSRRRIIVVGRLLRSACATCQQTSVSENRFETYG